MRLSRLLLVLSSCGVLLAANAGAASATTIEDLIKLKANKTTPVSDDVLIALIESDGSVFHLTADDIPGLRQKGLSERVIIAMLLTAKNARPAELIEIPPMDPSALPPAPESTAQSDTTQVAVPPDSTSGVQAGAPTLLDDARYDPRPAYTPTYVPVYVPVAVPAVRRPPPPAPEPVYWGYGGKLRPDAWQPAPAPQKTPTPDRSPDSKPDPRRGGRGGER